MLCPTCNKDFDSKFCPDCGYSPETAYAAANAEAANNSTKQGYTPPNYEQQAYSQRGGQPHSYGQQGTTTVYVNTVSGPRISEHNRWVALLLCFFVGFLGVHRFYVGKIGTGILFLVTFGFLGAGVVLDFLMILFGSFRDKDYALLR